MRQVMQACLLLTMSVAMTACVNDREMRKRDIQKFQQTAAGEYRSESGDTLVMVPVYARMIGLDTLYVERSTRNGTTGRIVALEPSADNQKIVFLSYVFTNQSQWRNLLAQPELLTALQPNDVRPAGTCDIKLADDHNSVTYSCAGGQPQVYQRVQHAAPE